MAITFTPQVDPDFSIPQFQLPSISGRTISTKDVLGKNGTLVMFICVHCPYVQAIETRLVTTVDDLKKIGIGSVAINSNDPVEYPEDNFESMKDRAKEFRYNFEYLQDLEQTVAKTFDAVCTPDFFLFDVKGKLFYRGRLDDSWKDSSKVTKQELLEAAELMTQGKSLGANPKPSMGCNIKWSSN